MDTPKGLKQAVFFCNGKNFYLQGVQEQRDLKSQEKPLYELLRQSSLKHSGNPSSSWTMVAVFTYYPCILVHLFQH